MSNSFNVGDTVRVRDSQSIGRDNSVATRFAYQGRVEEIDEINSELRIHNGGDAWFPFSNVEHVPSLNPEHRNKKGNASYS